MAKREKERIIVSKGIRFRLKIESSDQPDDYGQYETIRNEIWGFPDDHLSGTRNLLCENFLHEGSSLFIAAYREDPQTGWQEDEAHLVGFAYGFVGVRDKDLAFRRQDNLWFYAQFLGVKEEWQGFGLGIAIKEWQRDIVRDWFGIKLIVCTYDPLTAVNAYRNVHYFGMRVLEYRLAPYGEYGGRLNRLDIPSDRFFMGWDIAAKAKRPEIDGQLLFKDRARIINRVEEVLVEGKDGPVELEVIKEINTSPAVSPVLIRIPRDFYLMLRTTDVVDPKWRRIPLDWRLQTRELFLALFKQGYKVVDFIASSEAPQREAYYVLTKD